MVHVELGLMVVMSEDTSVCLLHLCQPLTQLCIHIIKCVCISMSGGVLCSASFYPGIGDCCLITLYIQIYINNIYIYINPCAKIQFLFSLIHSEPVCTVGNLLYKSV